MPTAKALFTDGRLEAAIEALGVEIRSNPTDVQRRSFLFELLTFAGQYERAAKQLDVLAGAGPMAEAGASVYRAALLAERVREHMFDSGDYPLDPRLGARLEVIAGGRYLWIPFAHVASISIEAPSQLRDLRWLKARVTTGPDVRDMDLGDVLIPALTPSVWKNPDAELRLGRAIDWEELPDGDFAPVGQKVWRIDGREVPLLEVRTLVLTTA